MRDAGLDGFLVTHLPNLRYLTGLSATAGAAIVTAGQCVLVVDFRYAVAARELLDSRGDGVVWWEACTVPYARNVEVTGSHIGLACNRKAYRVIGDALVP